MDIKIEVIDICKPDDVNVIIGQAHFIKAVEDIYEVLISSVPGIKFGTAFCEASGKCLIRVEGNDEKLREISADNASRVASGHVFIIALRQAYPINVLNAVKNIPEVCRVFCASANPLQVLVGVSKQGRGVVGVIDGFPPKGVEEESDIAWRKNLLRDIGYKR